MNFHRLDGFFRVFKARSPRSFSDRGGLEGHHRIGDPSSGFLRFSFQCRNGRALGRGPGASRCSVTSSLERAREGLRTAKRSKTIQLPPAESRKNPNGGLGLSSTGARWGGTSPT